MKNGVECYKDFFPYFKALKTNCGEALKIYNTEMDEFQSKILATKRVSAEAYDKMMEDLDNLKRNKKSTKCNPSRANSYNLEQAQSDINDIKETMKKLAETQDKILNSLTST